MIFEQNNRILLVDDNPAIHEDFRKILAEAAATASLEAAEAVLFDKAPSGSLRSTFDCVSAYQGEEALEKVTESVAAGRPFAVAFVDVRMPPGWDGIETIERLWKVDPALQVVVCTAYSDYSWEKMSEKLGVNENLVLLKKPFDNIEVLQLAHALARKWEVTQQATMRLETLEKMVSERTADLQASNNELRRSEERFSTAFRLSPLPFAIFNTASGRCVDANEAFTRMTGFSVEELIGRTVVDLNICRADHCLLDRFSRGESIQGEAIPIHPKAGDPRDTLVFMERITLSGEAHTLAMVQDVTERMRLEEQLRQAQKMEAIGQLAAGVAHDFNNLLTIIEGHASLQLATPGLTRDLVESLEQIEQAAERAADLTRQLLAFSRRQIIRLRAIDLNQITRDLASMLRRLIGERVELRWQLADSLPLILADQTSMEQILLNFSLNARDAMPKGGTITIATGERIVKPGDCKPEGEMRPGHFVWLSVTDTGTGMDESTRRRIWEPFFTTKEVNKGTGMGLATVYGIVKQHEGWIDLATAPGEGSTFTVLLPATEAAPTHEQPSAPTERAVKASEHTVLVVEDDEAVRGLVTEILQSDGFHVIEASNADHAMQIWRDRRDDVEILLTDMVMPGSANGLELAEKLLQDRPELKVIYTSGYSAELFASDVKLEDGVNYLPKPYLSSKLITMLHAALQPARNGAKR